MSQNSKIVMEGLTFDDVLLVPQASSILPHEVSLKTKITKNYTYILCSFLSILFYFFSTTSFVDKGLGIFFGL